jgi:hypothetical protein
MSALQKIFDFTIESNKLIVGKLDVCINNQSRYEKTLSDLHNTLSELVKSNQQFRQRIDLLENFTLQSKNDDDKKHLESDMGGDDNQHQILSVEFSELNQMEESDM